MPNLKISPRLLAGSAIFIGLAAMRYWSGQGTRQGNLLTGALLLIELGLVFYLESIAQSLKTEHLYYVRCKEEGDRLDARLDAAKLRVERSKEILDGINAEIADIDEHVKDRISKSGQIQNLIDLAVKTVIDGYNHGRAIVCRNKTGSWKFVDQDHDDKPDQGSDQ